MKAHSLLTQLTSAYDRFKEALQTPLSEPLALDGTIQRFEFTFELAWKALKVFLEDDGVICHSPRSCFKAAFRMGWIEDEEGWLVLLKARNMTAHVYNETMAREIYDAVKLHHNEFQALITMLVNQE